MQITLFLAILFRKNKFSYNNNFRTIRQNIPEVGKAHATFFLVQCYTFEYVYG